MDNKTHIRLVDTHTKSIGGHHNLHLVLHPKLLMRVARLDIQARVIESRRNAHSVKPIRNNLSTPAITHIHDGTASLHRLQPTPQHTVFVGLMQHIISHILALKTALKHILLPETETDLDIVDHFSGGRSGKGQDRCLGHIGPDIDNLQIRRTKVITPLRDAMRLIDSQKTDLHLFHRLHKITGLKTFRRDIEELQPAIGCLIISQFHFIRMHPRRDGRRRNAFRHKMSHLVLHQRNKWRDDKTKTIHSHRRNLKTDAFSASRGQKCQCVTTRHHRIDNVFLQGTETGITPKTLQYGTSKYRHVETNEQK